MYVRFSSKVISQWSPFHSASSRPLTVGKFFYRGGEHLCSVHDAYNQLLCRKNGALKLFAKRRQATTGLREVHGRDQRDEALRMV